MLLLFSYYFYYYYSYYFYYQNKVQGTSKRRKEGAEHIRMSDMKVLLEVTHMENVNHKSSNRDALFLRR